MVTLGHLEQDGTKLKANASKHKAMSYARMEETGRRLETEVQALLEQAQQVDAAEDAQYGRERRGDELPDELARRESRLAKIRAAKAALHAEAQARAAQAAAAGRAKRAAREHRVGGAKGRPAQVPDPAQAQPAPTAQRNFTDPESRIMVDGATKEFMPGYNAQAAVDSQAQVIVACGVTQAAADVGQFVPMLDQVAAHLGQLPAQVPADAGYFSEANLTAPRFAAIDFYVPPDRQPHGRAAAAGRSRMGPAATLPAGTFVGAGCLHGESEIAAVHGSASRSPDRLLGHRKGPLLKSKRGPTPSLPLPAEPALEWPLLGHAPSLASWGSAADLQHLAQGLVVRQRVAGEKGDGVAGIPVG